MGINIYVGNLAYEVSEAELEGVFAEFGQVDTVKIITDRETGRPKGFGFVEMPSKEEGTKAIQALNGKEVKSRPLKVSEARPKTDRGNHFGGGGRRGSGGRGRSRIKRGEEGGGGNYRPRH